MTGVSRRRVARFAVHLYPPLIRARYGAEILDLLAQSDRPVRDTVDVIRGALGEHGVRMSSQVSFRQVPTIALLTALPLAVGAALGAVATLAVMLLATVDPGAGHHVADMVVASAVLPVGILAVWAGRWIGHRSARAPLPPLVGLGLAVLAVLPVIGEALGEQRSAVLAGTAAWTGLLTGTAMAAAWAWRRRRSAAGLVLVIGGVLAVECACVVFGAGLSGGLRPGVTPMLWYPVGVTGIGADSDAVREAFKGFPAVTTVLTVLVLVAVYVRCRASRANRFDESAS